MLKTLLKCQIFQIKLQVLSKYCHVHEIYEQLPFCKNLKKINKSEHGR